MSIASPDFLPFKPGSQVLQLAIESSTRRASVALMDQEDLIVARSLDSATPTSAALLPAVEYLFREAGKSTKDLDLVSVSTGPGSFTGLRIGVMSAKTIAWGTGARLVGVDTHRLIAWQAARAIHREMADVGNLAIASLIPAQRGEWFAKLFQVANEELVPAGDNRIVDRDGLVSLFSGNLFFSGPGLEGACGKFVPQGPGRNRAPSSSWTPSAESLGILARESWHNGEFSDPFKLVPFYGRPSAAEEKFSVASQN
jgi:tRNA threonylcarbamoyladenosine biosynthesis protein TsaB